MLAKLIVFFRLLGKPIFSGCRVYKYLVDTSLSNLSSLEATAKYEKRKN